MQQSGATSQPAQPGSLSEAAEEVYQFPSFPEMPKMPDKPNYPWLHTSEQGATHAPHQNEQSSLPLHDRPVDPEGAIESSHVTLDSSKLPASSGLGDDPVLTGFLSASQRSRAGSDPSSGSAAAAPSHATLSKPIEHAFGTQAEGSGSRSAQGPAFGSTVSSSTTGSFPADSSASGSSPADSNTNAAMAAQQRHSGAATAQPQAASPAERQVNSSAEQAPPPHTSPGAPAGGATGLAGAGAAAGILASVDSPQSSSHAQPNSLQPNGTSTTEQESAQQAGSSQHNGMGGLPGEPAGQSDRQTGHSGQPATGSGHAQTTVNPVSDTATEIAGGSAGDMSGAPRSDEVSCFCHVVYCSPQLPCLDKRTSPGNACALRARLRCCDPGLRKHMPVHAHQHFRARHSEQGTV